MLSSKKDTKSSRESLTNGKEDELCRSVRVIICSLGDTYFKTKCCLPFKDVSIDIGETTPAIQPTATCMYIKKTLCMYCTVVALKKYFVGKLASKGCTVLYDVTVHTVWRLVSWWWYQRPCRTRHWTPADCCLGLLGPDWKSGGGGSFKGWAIPLA